MSRQTESRPTEEQGILVWEWPVRLIHWINAFLIAVFFATGLYIGHPVLQPTGEAYARFVMGWVRYIHFLAGYLFLATWIFRIYWFFAGNEHARNIFRFWEREAWRSVARHLRLLVVAEPDVELELPRRDQLARLVQGLFMIACIFMILSGFAMYGEQYPDSWGGVLTGWCVALFGSMAPVHDLHHLEAWFFPLFVVMHVYQVVRMDILTRRGLVSSMISGYYLGRPKDPAPVSPKSGVVQPGLSRVRSDSMGSARSAP